MIQFDSDNKKHTMCGEDQSSESDNLTDLT